MIQYLIYNPNHMIEEGGLHWKVAERPRDIYLPQFRKTDSSYEHDGITTINLTSLLIMPLIIHGPLAT